MKTILARSRALVAILIGAVVVAAVLNLIVGPALALYNDQTRKYPQRFDGSNDVEYYRFTLNYNDPNIATAQQFGSLGCNAYIIFIDADVTTAFNAGTTNPVTIGVSTSANEIVAASGSNASITAGSTGVQHLTAAAGLGVAVTGNSSYQLSSIPPCSVPLYAKYAQTGTAATEGSVTVVIGFIPNNDM